MILSTIFTGLIRASGFFSLAFFKYWADFVTFTIN